MMTLTELKLRRFRNHEDKTFKFNTGITGIIGNNGQGKSSIFEGINFIFTGDVWADSKAKVVTTGSNGSSFVRCNFVLNDKEGTIERHLDTSKVLLEYDGQKLNKAGEVKELWANLLQIDNHIFQHVIIARQGKIAELFSGDDSVREKAFQKIFLVPNTEKLRYTIWENYIKACPPPLPEEDEKQLTAQLAELTGKLSPLKEKKELMGQSVLTDVQHSSVINSITQCKRKINDALQRPKLDTERAEIVKRLEDLQQAHGVVNDLFDSSKLSQLKTSLLEANGIVSKLELITTLSKAIETAEAKLKYKTKQELAAKNLEIKELQTKVTAKSNEGAVLSSKVTALKTELTSFTSLQSKAVCPTCKQEIKNLAEHIAEINASVTTMSAQLQTMRQEYTALETKRKELVAVYEENSKLLDSLNTSRENLNSVSASLGDISKIKIPNIDEIKQEIAQFEEYRVLLDNCNTDILKTQNKLNLVDQRLNQLTDSTTETDPNMELSMFEEVLEVNKQRVERLNNVAAEIQYVELNITALEQRLVENKQNRARNEKRMGYMNKLKSAYDILHSSEFPRKLIQTYKGTVEEELLLQLQQFNLPYNATIDDNFKIITKNSAGHSIPTLSGGQEMIMGLCLRLALHSMFSSSFSFLCIDEGTTHLDELNKQLYFDAIVNLRQKKVINQLFIIDHEKALIEAVDSVIQL